MLLVLLLLVMFLGLLFFPLVGKNKAMVQVKS